MQIVFIEYKTPSCNPLDFSVPDRASERNHATEHQPIPESDGDRAGEVDWQPGEGQPRGHQPAHPTVPDESPARPRGGKSTTPYSSFCRHL